MEKIYDTNSFNHQIMINERKNIVITGIKKIISFDKEEFLIDSNMGLINLKGEELEIVKLDTHDGNITIKGKVNSFTYSEDEIKKESGLLAKLFK